MDITSFQVGEQMVGTEEGKMLACKHSPLSGLSVFPKTGRIVPSDCYKSRMCLYDLEGRGQKSVLPTAFSLLLSFHEVLCIAVFAFCMRKIRMM
ncbi:MAG TPA: hypothetical protein VJB10_01710, partial [Candidatus Peribacteraceae bacterium]|nr:hypothetical protein [Candidatus Peribacteraceae bacterium]